MLNPYRRSVYLPDRLGACLITGTEKIRCGYGNGDCLLLNFHQGVFAVADATERFPQASRILLERLETEISAAGPPTNETEFERLLSRIWSQQKFIHKTTLSCVVLQTKNKEPAVMLANNGDSSITVLNPGNGPALVRTAPDMNFAGRSRSPNPVSTVRLEHPGATIVLATDGLNDLGDMQKAAAERQPDRLVPWIRDRLKAASRPLEIDDIGAIALVANGPAAKYDTVIMGGTRPAEESGFVQSACHQPAMDRWDSIAAWRQSPEIINLAGIQIR